MASTEFFYDVVVVGGGHAGCEAARAAARLGARTCLITMDLDKLAQMSCNPAVGGIAKGQIVREIDALGGMMGRITDKTALQFRMLNRSKGPAMWSPRAQCDRMAFSAAWREEIEHTQNLNLWQDQVVRLLVENKRAVGVETQWGVVFHAGAVVLSAGTFLNGLMHIGRKKVVGGRIAEPAATELTECLTQLGLTAGRMKTGTPVRIDARSVDFAMLEKQEGENEGHRFSFLPTPCPFKPLPCWICNTNEEVHEVLRRSLPDSPLYNGQIQSIGPRYCPSIETKIVTFADRDHHPLFLEPEGENTNEMYLNGFSSSLPIDVQIEALRHIPAFRNVEIYRPGYAIEYDYFDPTELKHSLESKKVEALFLAGQVNGTTGYEEAAGQGIVAGINAARKTAGSSALTLGRDEAYIGVLIDDLVTKGVDEPYRMFTSRAEYRILLRQDNADRRLTQKGKEMGLVGAEQWNRFQKKNEFIETLQKFIADKKVKTAAINPALKSVGSEELARGCSIEALLRRPQITINWLRNEIPELNKHIKKFDEFDETLSHEVVEAVEVETKYEGYIKRERAVAEKEARLEAIKIAGKFDYRQITQISIEARQKLQRIQPVTLGQAARIPGVSPNDVAVLMILVRKNRST